MAINYNSLVTLLESDLTPEELVIISETETYIDNVLTTTLEKYNQLIYIDSRYIQFEIDSLGEVLDISKQRRETMSTELLVRYNTANWQVDYDYIQGRVLQFYIFRGIDA